MSKVRKRRNRSDGVPTISVKKYKKTESKKDEGIDVGMKISDCETTIPKRGSDLTELKLAKGRKPSPKKVLKSPKKTKESGMQYETSDIKSLNIAQLLDLGEGKSCETHVGIDSGQTSQSEEEDWEEVKMEEKVELKDPVIPKEGVNITLEVPGMNAFKRKKKAFDLEAHIKRQLNKVKRELQLVIHKVHVLGWIAHMKFVNAVLNSETLMGVSLSLVSNKNLYPPKYADLGYLERIMRWFHSVIELKEFLKNPLRNEGLSKQLCQQFGIKTAYSKKHYVFMMIVLLRTLGLKTRLVMSFQVVPIRSGNVELSGNTKQGESLKSVSETTRDPSHMTGEGEVKIIKVENTGLMSKDLEHSKCTQSKKKDETFKNGASLNSNKSFKSVINKAKIVERKLKSEKEKRESRKKTVKKECKDSEEGASCKSFKGSFGKEKRTSVKNTNSYNGELSVGKEEKVETSNIKGKPCISKIRLKKVKLEEVEKVNGSKVKRKKSEINGERRREILEKSKESSDTDSDFDPKFMKKNMNGSKIDRRVLSSDDDEDGRKVERKGVDVWAEIFLEAEEKWISVDVIRQKVHCVHELYRRATQPVLYVVACNNDSTLKDVTKRYVPNWHSDTRKKRVDEIWWNETMWPYLGPKTVQDREEDEDINKQLLDKPLPGAISEYKDHPLYALKRHLLKFEGIYPPDAPTLGYIRGEPVYARECVVTLRSREVWYKEARVVRPKEEAYKIVKARPKYDKMSGTIKKDLPLELFGIWQTEEYMPPIAKDGKVPRNEYGNVDLFKPCMLPRGTVHLQIPALNRVAKKLGIDCAAAVVGFEFHSGASHPLTDGFVVCEEFKHVLLDAWNKEIDETNKKNEEKRLKRIYGNWKRLIRGLLIREKLKIKYDFGGESSASTSSKAEQKCNSKTK